MDKFEKTIKNAVEHYEVPYTEAAWDSFSKKLGPEKGFISKWVIGISAVAVIASAGVWYLSTTPTPVNITQEVSANQTEKDLLYSETTTEIKENSNQEKNIQTKNPVAQPKVNAQNSPNTGLVEGQSKNKKEETKAIQPTKLIHLNNFEKVITPAQNTLPVLKPLEEKNELALAAETKTIDYSSFNLQVVSNRTSICLGEAVILTPSIPKIKAKYQWDMGDGTLLSTNLVEYTYKNPGTYRVTINLLDEKTEELLYKSEVKFIEILALPENAIQIEIEEDLIPTAYISLREDQMNNQVDWELTNLYKSSQSSFQYSFKEKGDYRLNCTITGSNGCQNTMTRHIEIANDYNLLAPNAFSPNGDLLNDYFIPKALLIDNKPFTMSIYNKAGSLLYQTNEATRPWDGLYTKDRTQAPSGIYIWVVEQTNEFGEEEIYRGHVTITR
ncbi:hypothetical protein DNU06_08670 [Putridiphycobacter roseus]|uniref:PKD domain-containing protein n=1 Tax=Putridiphycobacter roseus TaxID=2219161 RepID=A0A2W1NDZ8_9FLAO|nr:gliding motility-associated C-terminal domain-containing protein [Putridiphycobacter roseus]PZE17333.1 hypothetical protein DNU06_08670 [Putridiphycobacter roseus]